MATIVEESTKGLERLIDGIGDFGRSAVDGMHQFAQSVNGAFPDVGENGPRAQIIDSAFSMTRSVVDASGRLATNVISSAGRTVEAEPDGAAKKPR